MRILQPICFLPMLVCCQLRASNLPAYFPPGCDTLITTDGEVLLVHLGWQGEAEIQYTRCDSESGRVYGMARDKIREVRKYNGPLLGESATPPPPAAPSRPEYHMYPLLADTFDLLTLTNGKKYRVLILERDYLNTYYRLYDDLSDDRQYVVPNQEVRSVRMAKTHAKRQSKNGSRGVALIILAVLLVLLLLA